MSRQHRDFDVIVIGGGSAGVEAALRAGGYCLRTLLVEKTSLGGERLGTGAVCSAALRHAAATHPPEAAFEYARNALAQAREADDSLERLNAAGVNVRIGKARFVSENTIDVDGIHLCAGDFVLCTGSSPARPDIPGLEDAGYLTNRNVFQLPRAPDSLAVVGGGQVGIELAQTFARLGSRVVVLEENGRILEDDDAELTSMLADRLRSEGVDIRLDARLETVEPGKPCHLLRTRGFGGPSEVSCESILVTTGRVANTDGLNLGAAGVEMTARGVITDPNLHTTGPHVWACGDVRGVSYHTHVAVSEARRVLRNIFLPGDSSGGSDHDFWTTFTDPELAHLGRTEDEAREMGLSVAVIRQRFDHNDRAIAADQRYGVLKLIIGERNGRILGVHILGAHAGELINEWALAMRHGLPLKAIADLPHIYPTLSDSSQRAAQQWCAARAERPGVQRTLDAYGMLRANREPVIYTLAAAGLVAGLLWAVNYLAGETDE